MEFQKLTPKNDVNLNGYEEAFNFVFKNDDIRNVAISGAYSSGKSSVLESYKIKHTEKRFLHISLTHFTTLDEENQLEESLSNNKVSESILEGKILNQLIHHIPINKIPTAISTQRFIKFLSVFIMPTSSLDQMCLQNIRPIPEKASRNETDTYCRFTYSF